MTIQEIQCVEFFFRKLRKIAVEKYGNVLIVEDMYDEYNTMLKEIIRLNSSISSAERKERGEV